MTEDSFTTKMRRELIRQLIMAEKIGTQEQLVESLRLKGVETTQSTVSRDIKELRLVKTGSAGNRYYAIPERQEKLQLDDNSLMMFKNVVLRIDQAMNQVVIHTATGMAPGTAAMLDKLHWPPILGTLAGDDTIVIIAKTPETAMEIMEALTSL